MKIRINRFCFFVPLSYGIIRLLIRKSKTDYLPVLDPMFSSLKEYTKENGHFNIVEIEQKNGNQIVISV